MINMNAKEIRQLRQCGVPRQTVRALDSQYQAEQAEDFHNWVMQHSGNPKGESYLDYARGTPRR